MPSTTRIPDYLLEQYALGELPSAQMREIDRRIQDDPELSARLRELTSSNEEILRRHPPAWFAAEVAKRAGVGQQAKPKRSASGMRSPLMILVPVVSAAMIALFVLRAPDDVSSPVAGLAELTGTRIKGLQPAVHVYRKADDGAQRIDSTVVVQRGDILQLSYVAAGRTHGVIVSVDGRGSTTLHFPETRGSSTELAQGGEIPVMHAYEIDDAPDFERFFFVTDSLDIRVDDILQAAQDLARSPENAQNMSLPLQRGEQHAVVVHKKEVR